jgi:membrane protease YdiL (CAAX protease family)
MTPVKVFFRKHPVLTYFALTFVISWSGALLVIGGSGGMSGTAPTSDPRFLYALLAMLAGPSISGILLTSLVHGRDGLREFVSRAVKWRVATRWYAVALMTAPLLWSATLFALWLTSSNFRPGIFTSEDKASLVLVGLAAALAAGIFEELGWTGFAIPQFRRRHGVFATGLFVGVLWAAWHLLTNVLWASRASAGDLPLAIFLPTSVFSVLVGYLAAFRVLMVWVYDRSGSLLVAMLMHVSITASVLILDPAAISGVASLTYSFVLATAVWAAVGLVAVRNGWHRADRRLRSVRRAA